MKKTLINFLGQHPWSSKTVIKLVFEKNAEILLFSKKNQLQTVEIGVETYYALANEPKHTLLGIQGLDMIRRFVANNIGADQMFYSYSPGISAPYEGPLGKIHIRIWYDTGNISVEALGFLRDQPTKYSNVKDIILTRSDERIDPIRNQIYHFWSSNQPVFIWNPITDYEIMVEPKATAVPTKIYELTSEDLYQHINNRLKDDKELNDLVEEYIQYTEHDFENLIFIGDHPFLEKAELCLLKEGTSSQKQASQLRSKQAIVEFSKKIDLYFKRGLIDIPLEKNPGFENRYRLTAKAFDLLLAYWNTNVVNIHRFQPWPKTMLEDGKHIEYSTNWMTKLFQHQKHCRQFILALTLRARSISNSARMVKANSETMIGSKITFVNNNSLDEKKIQNILPDGKILLNLYEGNWNLDSEERMLMTARYALFIEIDEGTNAVSRISQRLDKYAMVWESLKEGVYQPILIWLTYGHHATESQLIKEMQKRSLDGYVTAPFPAFENLPKRLILPEDDPYWITAPAAYNGPEGNEEYRMIAGMAPYRKIWYSTFRDDFKLDFLLGINPADESYKKSSPDFRGSHIITGSARTMGAKSFKKGRPNEKPPKLMSDYDKDIWE